MTTQKTLGHKSLDFAGKLSFFLQSCQLDSLSLSRKINSDIRDSYHSSQRVSNFDEIRTSSIFFLDLSMILSVKLHNLLSFRELRKHPCLWDLGMVSKRFIFALHHLIPISYKE